jgi:HprK-related kinase A
LHGFTVKLGELAESDVASALGGPTGIAVSMGPFVVRIRASIDTLAGPLALLYRDFQVHPEAPFADFHVSLEPGRGLRRWYKPQVQFKLDGLSPFEPFPRDTALPLFEWGLNWCIGQRCHQYLILHAASLERNGKAVLLPAHPGSGKSTLCAAMANRGWRLLSDEFGLYDLDRHCLVPLPRPVALKNASIEVIRRFAPEATLGPLFPKTRKGTVAHLRPSPEAVARMEETARPALVVFPKFIPGSPVIASSMSKGHALLRLAHNAFNYEVTGADGFKAAARIIRGAESLELCYGDLDAAIAKIDRLVS